MCSFLSEVVVAPCAIMSSAAQACKTPLGTAYDATTPNGIR
jgi:hypothetical protein